MKILPKGTLELCELCGEPLDADNCYGSDEFPLCREHHDAFGQLVAFMLIKTDQHPRQMRLIVEYQGR